MIDRIEGVAKGKENVFGISPTYEEIYLDRSELHPEQFKTVTHIDKAAWVEELKLHEELFKQLAYHLPAEMTATKAALAVRLEA
jgi:phosphoenolpyruvate carboxykinase (GTP)